MSFLWRWVKRALVFLILLLVVLIIPVAYVEFGCNGNREPAGYRSIVGEQHIRPETRTFMTYPEWHIVHAYEDYAETIKAKDPHDFRFMKSITGFWTSLCAVKKISTGYGEVGTGTKQMVYVIGTSFSVELALKALYEETVGRVAIWFRGKEKSVADMLSAEQAGEYAAFLQQVPWYQWSFTDDLSALSGLESQGFRDRERKIALGLEYRAKAAYARVIADAVESTGEDALSLRMVVSGMPAEKLKTYRSVTVIAENSSGIEIEVPRYRALTELLKKLSVDGANFVEIAGNDDILFTVLSGQSTIEPAIYSVKRQGFSDYRHLVVSKVSELSGRIKQLSEASHQIEHIHDY